jgi:hypothetical protein
MGYGTGEGGGGATLIFVAAALFTAIGAGYFYSGGGNPFESKSDGTSPSGAKVCSNCRGTGRASCGTCGGKGKVRFIFSGEVGHCPACGGGKNVSCKPCHGNGKVFPSSRQKRADAGQAGNALALGWN